jgi:putative heme-binding domain-containing protein
VLTDSLIRETFGHFDAETRAEVERFLESRLAGQAEQTQRLEELLARLPAGDIRRGQQVFHSSKAACFTCHAMGYRGGDVGPDLTRIGRIRSRRDLLEAIAFPSLSFVRSYEPLSVTTKSGLTFQGVVKDENQERLLLVNDQRKVVEVARSEIEFAEPGRVSVMPSGLDQLLTEAELADLLAFLEAAR